MIGLAALAMLAAGSSFAAGAQPSGVVLCLLAVGCMVRWASRRPW